MYLFPVFIFRRKPRYRNLSHAHCYPTSSPRIEDENTLRVSLQSRIHQVEPTENKLNSSKGLTLYQFWKVLAQMYLLTHYSNGFFGNVYLLTLDDTKR